MRHNVNIKITLLLACLLFGTFGAKISAQTAAVSTIKGVVTDEYGKALYGVVVNSANGKNGTSTDIEGNYILTVNDGSESVVFSTPGYKNQAESIIGEEVVDAKMKFDAHHSDEIVEMGFSKQRLGDVSGAVNVIKGKSFESAPVATFAPAMNGFATNLMMWQNSNQPGNESVQMMIRGASNPQSPYESPLVIIDGVFSTYLANETFNYLTAKEIESITLLKDASTQAMYGVKGNRGVLVITTKRGVKGPVNINVSYNQSIQQPTVSPRFYHSWEYATFRNEAAYNDNHNVGKTSQYSAPEIAKYLSGEDRDFYPDNNWKDIFFKQLSTMSRANIDISGGSDKFTYYTYVNFMHQGNQFKTTNDRYKSSFNTNWFNYRSNVDMKVNKYLSAYLRLSGTIRRDREPNGGSFSSLYSQLWYRPANIYGPVTPTLYDDEGNVTDKGGLPIIDEKFTESIYGDLNRSGYHKSTIVNINSQFGLDLDLDFVTKGLNLGAYIAYQTYGVGTLYTSQSYQYVKRTNDPTVLEFETVGSSKDTELSYSKGSGSYYHLDYRAYLDYQRTFGKHSVQATGFFYFQNMSTADMSSNNILPFNTALSGFQAAYGYDNRYFVKVDVGYSATEQFAPEHRWVSTPSISGAWNLANEHFMDNVKWLTNFKLRASYGRVADDELSNGRHGYLDNNTFSYGGVVTVLAYTTSEGKKGYSLLQAEFMLKQNYGIDLGLFNGFSFSFDYFKERMDNRLISATSVIPSYQGIPTSNYPGTQVGTYENKGYDLSASYYKRFNADWSFNVGTWVSFARNKILYEDEARLGESYAYRNHSEGFPIGMSWGLKTDWSNGNGLFNTQEELDNYQCTYGLNMSAPRLGDVIYQDLNGDYIIDEKDYAPLGYGALPEIYYAFNAGFTYKALEFNIMFQGVGRTTGIYMNSGREYNGVYNCLLENAWTAERYAAGKKITAPALSLNSVSSDQVQNDYYLNDAAFLRLKNVEIAYTLPLKTSRVISAEKIRFSLSGQNLVTWSRMKNKDINPESGGLYSVPAYRVYNIGVSVLF
ncbi:MAG: SusC/RagA family TonB-linked outer membrane protein [Alistipes sp.]|nr:SusC/RagA family TonB-linked outer membrane protein [Alistipes sp.]